MPFPHLEVTFHGPLRDRPPQSRTTSPRDWRQIRPACFCQLPDVGALHPSIVNHIVSDGEPEDGAGVLITRRIFPTQMYPAELLV